MFSFCILLLLHSSHIGIFMLHYFHVVLFSSCTFSMLHSFHAAFFSCCILFMLHSFHVELFSCCTLFTLHSFHVALFSYCTLFMLQSVHVTLMLHFFHVALFTCCILSMLNSLNVALFSCCIILILKNIENERKTENTTKKRPYTQHLELIWLLFWYPKPHFCHYIPANTWTLIFGWKWKLSRRTFIDLVSTLAKQRWNNVDRITSIQRQWTNVATRLKFGWKWKLNRRMFIDVVST